MRVTQSVMCECVLKIRRIWHAQFVLMCQFTAKLANQMWRINEWHTHFFIHTMCESRRMTHHKYKPRIVWTQLNRNNECERTGSWIFFTEAVNTVVWFDAVGLMCAVTTLLKKKKKVYDMTNWQFLINKHKKTTLPKSLFSDLEADIWTAKLLYK